MIVKADATFQRAAGFPGRGQCRWRFAVPLFCLLTLVACANALPPNRGLTLAAADDQPIPPPAGGTYRQSFSKDVLYKLLVGEMAARRGDPKLAVKNYLEAAHETRDPAVAERAVRLSVFAKDEEQGLEAAELWTTLQPANDEALQVYAALLLRAGDVDEAVDRFETLIARWDKQSSETPGISRIADMLTREPDTSKSLEVMERLVAERADEPDALFALASVAARADKLGRALELLAKVREIEPDNTAARVFYARILQQQGDVDGAITSLAAALEKSPDDQSIRMSYARLLVDAERYEEALGQFNLLVEARPENGDVRYAVGLLLLQTERPDEAETHFQALIDMGNRVQVSHFYLGQIAESKKDFASAIASYSRVSSGDHYLNAAIRIAVLTAEQGDVAGAREQLHALPRRNDADDIRLIRAEAEILISNDDREGAMGVFDAAVAQYPDNNDILYARAMLAENLDRIDVLERDLRKIIASDPENADALNALGYTLADRTDRHEEAFELISRALALKPDNHYIVDSMGWVLYRLGRYDEALKQLRRAMSLQGDPEIAAHLGEVLWVTGEKQEAREVLKTALESAPDDERLLELIKKFKP